MAKKYPILVRKTKAKYARAYGKCQYPDCAEWATHRLLVQENYMRGDDEFYRYCDTHTADCEKRCAK